jgi:L,D-transpeptidase catalytic domain
MKTNGPICACARQLLPVLAFLIATPAFAQVNFTSSINSLFAHRVSEPEQNWKNFHAGILPGIHQGQSGSSTLLLPGGENSDIASTTGLTIKKETDKSVLPVVEKSEPPIVKGGVRFRPTSFSYPQNSRYEVGVANYPKEQLLIYARSLKEYAEKNGYDTTYVFLGNMGMLSNKKRLFVVNLKSMEIEISGLVSNGRGTGRSVLDKQYSNEKDSKCTSLGRYKIVKKYKGSYGPAYRMAGLDPTNKNAYDRNIVLHSMMCIPDVENIMPACVSEGCPSVSAKFLASLSKIIDTRKKPVLLWLFDSNLEEIVPEEPPVRDIDIFTESGYAEYYTFK